MPKKPTSGLLLRIQVETEDGKVLDLQSAMVDVLRWERDNDGQSFALDNTITGVLHLAWLAGKRLGLVEGIDHKGWSASVVDYRVVDQDEKDNESDEEAGFGLDPTTPAPSTS